MQTLSESKHTFLFAELYIPYPNGKKLYGFGYHLQKMNQLVEKIYPDSALARYLISEMRGFFDEYLNIDEAQNDFELFTLVSTALFLYKYEIETTGDVL